ncbi:MAG: hypothetical protein REI09_10845 [Candidatus Dactylopiibacterium sp.]|nr:hypothetical protein [Candidatus Dactylopiibacterium sp.]
MASSENASSNIPHRFWLLAIFRSLGAGNALVVAGPGAFAHYLDGVPQVALLTDYLRRHDWLLPAHAPHDVKRYRLSAKGFAFWQEGERWWRGLSFLERCRVRLLG